MRLGQATPNRLFNRSAGHGTRPGVIQRAEPGESLKTPQAHWNWDEYQRQETMLKHDVRMSSPKQTVQSKQLSEPGVASALSDEGNSGNEEDGTQTNSDASVRPVTLPEGLDRCFEFTTASCGREAAAQDNFQRWWASFLSALAHVEKCGKLCRTAGTCEGRLKTDGQN